MTVIASGIFTRSIASKSRRGDRYRGQLILTARQQHVDLDLYLPQCFRRGSALSVDGSSMALSISLCSGMPDQCVCSASCADISLTTCSKSTGGDKYTGRFRDGSGSVSIYLPQIISRANGISTPQLVLLVETNAQVLETEANHLHSEMAGITERLSVDYFAKGFFSLTKAAKGRGGDRYDGEFHHPDTGHTFAANLYIPQIISRLTNQLHPIEAFNITLCKDTHIRSVSVISMKLAKQAKSSGGDKYEGLISGSSSERVSVYLPQGISRYGSSVLRSITLVLLKVPLQTATPTFSRRSIGVRADDATGQTRTLRGVESDKGEATLSHDRAVVNRLASNLLHSSGGVRGSLVSRGRAMHIEDEGENDSCNDSSFREEDCSSESDGAYSSSEADNDTESSFNSSTDCSSESIYCSSIKNSRVKSCGTPKLSTCRTLKRKRASLVLSSDHGEDDCMFAGEDHSGSLSPSINETVIMRRRRRVVESDNDDDGHSTGGACSGEAFDNIEGIEVGKLIGGDLRFLLI